MSIAIKPVRFAENGFMTRPFAIGGEGAEGLDPAVKYRSCLQNWVIDTGSEVILVDTGVPADFPFGEPTEDATIYVGRKIKPYIEALADLGYKPEQVSDELLDAVLRAGSYAASGMNNQKAIMVAVRDKETRDLLSRLNARVMDAQTDPFYGAPCVMVVLSDPGCRTWVEDGSLVMGNMLNAAVSLSLGCCWIHRAKEVFDLPEGKALLKKWGLSEDLRGIGNCIVGYPDGEPVQKPRAEGRIVKVD